MDSSGNDQVVQANRRKPVPTRRYRSTVACQACRQRKVRCSYMVTGAPCSYCIQDGTDCIVNTQRLQILRPRNHSVRSRGIQSQQNADTGPNTPSPTMSSLDNLILAAGVGGNCDSRTIPLSRTADTTNRASQEENEERSVAGIARTILGNGDRDGEVPYFVGEPQGATYLLDIVDSHRQKEPTHILIPAPSSTSLQPEDLTYLKAKGVFSLPMPEVCKSLFSCYFHHVHPIMPVVDAHAFLNLYFHPGLERVSLLLLWSMFFVAANFASVDTRSKAGFASIKEMKRCFYIKAKCLFDVGMETDKTALLQSSLLLSFWHSETDVHFQPWYWSGAAIHYCQMLGLYRDTDLRQRVPRVNQSQCRTWRRIWWTCVFRDRWLSLTLGRPLRIDVASCSTPLPSTEDFLDGQPGTSNDDAIRGFMPSDLPRLARYWVKLIRLANLLGDVLILNYRTNSPCPTVRQIEALENEITQASLDISEETRHGSQLATFYAYHYQLHYQAVLIALYRPYSKRVPIDLNPSHHDDWRSALLRKITAAASQTNSLLGDIVSLKLLGFAGPMTPALIVPAMHNHLLSSASSDPLTSRLALNKLDFCLIVMKELQQTYTAAALFRTIFSEAMHKLHSEYRSSSDFTSNETQTIETPVSMNQDGLNAENAAEYFARVGDMVFDESNVFSFWDTPLLAEF